MNDWKTSEKNDILLLFPPSVIRSPCLFSSKTWELKRVVVSYPVHCSVQNQTKQLRSLQIKVPNKRYICKKINLETYLFCVLPDDLSPMSTTLATIPVRTIARVIFTNPGLDCVGNTIFTRATTPSPPQVFTITRRACWTWMGLCAFVCVILGQRFQIPAVPDTFGGATKLPCTLKKTKKTNEICKKFWDFNYAIIQFLSKIGL